MELGVPSPLTLQQPRASSMDASSRRSSGRDISPDLVKACRPQQKVKPLKKVQVVYYLSRSGLLEHPHFMELTLFPNQPLRLKDVLDRLVALRGSGMPSLYSWSCKRSYRRGYVWYDLTDNDIIHPAEGAEYVLKGSQLVEGCSERVEQLHVSKRGAIHQHRDPNLISNRKSFRSSPHTQSQEYQEYEEQEQEEEECFEDAEKTSYTSSTTTPHSRCSRGVSTDEDHETKPQTQTNTTKASVNHALPPSSTPAHKLNRSVHINEANGFEEGLAPSRNSILLQLIACGSSAVSKAKNAACVSNAEKKRESGGGVEREVVKVTSEDEMIKCMSENPRFGNLQSEEKEYFSGSLVESRKEKRVDSEAVLKKSSSYNQERSRKLGIGEEEEEEEKEKEEGGKGKCIPGNRCGSKC